MDLETINETVAHVKAQALVERGKDKLAQVDIDARGNTQVSLEAYVLVDTLPDKLAELMVLTLNQTLAHIKARGCPHTHLQARRGGE